MLLVGLFNGIATFAQTEMVPSNTGSEAFDNITREETPEIVNNSYPGLLNDDAVGLPFGDTSLQSELPIHIANIGSHSFDAISRVEPGSGVAGS
jgi:hypothetical protein